MVSDLDPYQPIGLLFTFTHRYSIVYRDYSQYLQPLFFLFPSGWHLNKHNALQFWNTKVFSPLWALRKPLPLLSNLQSQTWWKCLVCLQCLSIFPRATQWLTLYGSSSSKGSLLIAIVNGNFSVLISSLFSDLCPPLSCQPLWRPLYTVTNTIELTQKLIV